MDEGFTALYRKLGLIDQDDELNDTGRRLLELPLSSLLSVRHARIILEAIDRGVVSDVLTLIAMVPSEGIRDHSNELWTMNTGGEQQSDLMAELALWKRAAAMPVGELPFIGVHPEAYLATQRRRQELVQSLAGRDIADRSTGNRHDIIASWIMGYPDHLFRLREERTYLRGHARYKLGQESVIPEGTQYVVALPVTVWFRLNEGAVFHTILKLATEVSVEQMVSLAPHMKGVRYDNFRYFPPRDRVICHRVQTFGDTDIAREMASAGGDEAVKAFAMYLVNSGEDLTLTAANVDKIAEVQMLNSRAPDVIGTVPPQSLRDWYVNRLGSCSSVLEVGKRRIDLTLDDDDISTLLHIDYPSVRERILQTRPDSWSFRGIVYPLTYVGPDPTYVDLTLPAQVWLEVTEQDLPSIDGVTLRMSTEGEQFADIRRQSLASMQASLSLRLLAVRNRESLIRQFAELQTLAGHIDWSQAESYGIRPDENIPRQLERLSSRILNGSTSVSKLTARVAELRKRLLTALNDPGD